MFDASRFEIPEITAENTAEAKNKLNALFVEFEFASDHDQAAAISGIFTAVTRPTLPHAPAYHVKAHVIGSGKPGTITNKMITMFKQETTKVGVKY